MPGDNVLGEFAENGRIPLIVRRLRCLRIRFNRSGCLECLSACRRDAIKLEGGISIDEDACTGCLRCSAVCPTGALEVRGCDFNGVVSRLGKSERPVLGCNGSLHSKAHARVPCLGMLSAEHLIFLGVFLNRPIQLNLTGCAQCENRSVTPALEETFDALQNVYGIDSVEIVPVENADALDYQDIVIDRRGFFRSLRILNNRSAADITQDFMSSGENTSCSQKSLSAKRKLINRAYLSLAESEKINLLSMWYDCCVEENCNICAACVGACPSGAIKVARKEDMKELLFLSSRCSGCGLCEEFCKMKALHVSRGFQGNDPFDYQSLYVREKAGKPEVLWNAL